MIYSYIDTILHFLNIILLKYKTSSIILYSGGIGMKKICYILIIGLSILILNPINVKAASEVAIINDIKYISLEEAVIASKDGDTIKLLQDIDTTSTSTSQTVLNFANNVTLDLNNHTIKTKNMDYIYRGFNLTIQNGNFATDGSYALFIGDIEDTDNVLLKNLKTEGGINIFNSTNVIIDNVSSTAHNYYSVWADEHAQITIKSGEFTSTESTTALIGISLAESFINIEGGNFIAKNVPLVLQGNYYNPTIYGGTFDTDPSSYIASNAKITTNNNQYIVGYSNNIVDIPLVDDNKSDIKINLKDVDSAKEILEDALKKANINHRNTKIEIIKKLIEKDPEQENELLDKINNKNYTIANLFDITLRIIDSDTNELITNIKDTNKELEFQIDIPDAIKNQDENIIRTYYIIRKHDDKVEVLDTKLIDSNKLSFKSDSFSIYALAYLDTKKEEPIDNPATYDNIGIYLSLGAISIFSLLISSAYYLKMKKSS